jgi:transposase
MDGLSLQELLAENCQLRLRVAEQQRLIEQQQRTIEQLQQTVRQLHDRLDVAERAAKRQAAPFSKGEPKERPKKPGRKKGEKHGRHGHRPPPPENEIDEVLESSLPCECPHCRGAVEATHVDVQYQTDIPRKPIHRRINIHCGRCRACGKSVRGRHPQQTSNASGAARSQVGPDAQAAVAYLNKHSGMSHGKISDYFDKCHGIKLTRGAAAQIVLRAGRRLAPAYQEIKQQICDAKHLTPDESGWRVGGRPAWVHAWVADNGATCYAIEPRRGAAVLQAVIGADWSGAMTHDGYSSYDKQFPDATHQQCVDHAMRRARSLRDQHCGRAREFPGQVLQLFGDALTTRDRILAGELTGPERDGAHEDFVGRLLDLTKRPRANAANELLAQHLYGHAEHWLMFLNDPTIPATNHRAEQALKTPIVNRKVWGGNRTWQGACAQEITTSVLQTCRNKAKDVVSYVSDALRGFLGHLFPPPARPPTGR